LGRTEDCPPCFVLQKLQQPLYAQPSFANDCPQGSFGDFPMIGNRNSAVGRCHVSQNQMAARLVVKYVADLLKGSDYLLPRDPR
jgi:hypothetical protein